MTNIPSPYRVDFFNELGKLCDLTVLFETETAKDRNSAWMVDKIKNFKAVFMKGIRVGTAEAFCPEVLKYVGDQSFERIVVGMYSSPTGMLAIEFMRLKKIPFILSLDGGIKKNDLGIKHKIKAHFISSASQWLSTGKATTEYLEYYGADLNQTYVYPFTSIREKEILEKPLLHQEKKRFREKLGMKEKKIVLSVGQFIYRKGYDILLNACKGLDQEIGIYIVGGQATEEYIKMKENLGLTNVHFIDFKKKEELVEYYSAADLFVLPTREDIWGLVINEAMAYGLPIITTYQCVAGLEMIQNGVNGWLVESSAEDLNKMIKKFFNLKHLNIMQEKCLYTAKKYSIEEMTKVHWEVFTSEGGKR